MCAILQEYPFSWPVLLIGMIGDEMEHFTEMCEAL